MPSLTPASGTGNPGAALGAGLAAPGAGLDVRVLPRSRAWYWDVWVQMLRQKPLGTTGALIVVVMLAAAVLADVVAPYGFSQTSLRERLQGTSAAHWLGTDQLGRDVLTRLLYGARVSLYVGFGAVALGSLIATAVGILSAYFGGRVDLLVQRGVDAWMAFPGLLLLMSIMSLIGPGVWNITLVLGVAFGIQNSRVVRGVALSIKEHTYVEGARAVGAGHARVAVSHILSFLGLGVPPPFPTWGGMLSLAGLDHMYQAPWLAVWPAVALSLAVFGFNMLGDALRDLLDPRLKGG
jgi:peptide/nickel transport system permease protein